VYQQHYTVGNKKFIGAYAGLYESAKTGQYCHFVLPQYHIDQFLKVDVPSLKNYSSKDLMKQKLAQLRDENNRIRLNYSGGDDSHTILLIAQEMGIEFDCVFMYTNSILEDPHVEYEYCSAIEYAKTTDMNFVLHRPSISDFETVWKDKLSFTKINDFYHGFAPHYSELYFRDYEKDYLEIIGNDKPRYYCKDDVYYWIITDQADWGLDTEHEDFFLGSKFPELAVKQVLLGVDYIKKYYPSKQGFIDYRMLDVEPFCRYLNIQKGIDNKIRKTNKDHHEFGYLNEKHRRSLTQLIQLGRKDIIDDWIGVSKFIDETLKDVPFGIEQRNAYISEIDRCVKLTTNTVRIGAIFKILDDRLELMPHTDINKL
jgi:hypothetical protein